MTNTNNGRPEVGKYPLLFGDHNYPNLQVILVRIGSLEDNQYILKFTGIDHKWDGHFFELTKDGDDNRANYAINNHPDGEYNLITLRDMWGYLNYEMYIGLKESLKLYQVNGQGLNPEHILTEYLQYKEEGKSPF
jgi:hypothetical protein